jgi:hypothetical protein
MIADLVAKLIAAGTAPDVAAVVVTEAFVAGISAAPTRDVTRDERDENRREQARVRQQRRREKVTRDMRDKPEIVIETKNLDVRDVTRDEKAPLSLENNKQETKKERGASKAASRGQRLPDDWAPSVPDQVVADELIGTERRRDELAKFRDHWKQQPGSKGVKLDWDAAWRNWIRRSAEYGGNRNGHRNLNAPRRSASSEFFAGIAGVAADIAGNGATSGDAGPEVPLGRVNIDG